jgi:putative endonuclease
MSQAVSKGALGKAGETIAARHLERLGWKILAHNWRCAQGEIDLIAQDGDTRVVVEVRTRRGHMSLDAALASVNPRKQARLRQLAEQYRAEQGLPDATPLRIDVVGVALLAGGEYRVEVIHDAVGW